MQGETLDMEKRDVVRTIRLTDGLNSALESEAHQLGVSVSSLISSILTKYAEWDRLALRFGFASIDKEVLRSILEATKEAELRKAGREEGSRRATEMQRFWFGADGWEAYSKISDLISRFTGLYKKEVRRVGEDLVFVYNHELGPKWSVYLGEMIAEVARKVLHAEPVVMSTRSSVLVRLKLASSAKDPN
jgi:hypothetical protein